MQNIDLLNEFVVWIKGNISGIGVSIVASFILVGLKVVPKFFKKVYEHVSWKDRKGLDYIVVSPFKSETSKEMIISGFKFFISIMFVFVPFLLLFIILGVSNLLIQFGKIGVWGVGLCVFLLALYILYAQKYYIDDKKICSILETFLLAIILLFAILINVIALEICEDDYLEYYIIIVSLLLCFVVGYIFESKNSEQYYIKGIDKLKWIRYFGLVVGYGLGFSKWSDVGLGILFYTWFLICAIEYICAGLFGKKSLAAYTIKCKTRTYITHDNILQMKDGKVNFKIEDQDVCIIEKDEIECITYEMKSPRRQRENDRIIYIAKDEKKHICDGYNYLGKDWIEFRKYNIRNIEIIILPSEQISSIRSCNNQDHHSIIDGKES